MSLEPRTVKNRGEVSSKPPVWLRAAGMGLAALLLAVPAAARSIPGQGHYQEQTQSSDPPSRIAEAAGIAAAAVLPPAAVSDAELLQALLDHNRAGALPVQNGFTRRVPLLTVDLDAGLGEGAAAIPHAGGILFRDGQTIGWSVRLDIEGAYASRLHLERVVLPADVEIWVFGVGGEASGPHGVELLGPEGDIWLPVVEGSSVFVEVQVAARAVAEGEAGHFEIGQVMELFDLRAFGTKAWTDCDVDATCVDSGTLSMVDDYYNAVAHLLFNVGSSSYICSGALVNDSEPASWIPYLLTANHCLSTQASASSLIAYFDFRTSVCNGTPPGLGTVPKVFGSTLLATGSATDQSDFTFLQLNANPAGTNYYLGWTIDAPTHGQDVHRISHPMGTAQKYSRDTYLAYGGIVCAPDLPRPRFRYSRPVFGSTTGGSSGAPVIVDNLGGQIVGQLYGKCHYSTWDECDYGSYSTIDGAFTTTYDHISSWLEAAEEPLFADGFESGDTSVWSATVQ